MQPWGTEVVKGGERLGIRLGARETRRLNTSRRRGGGKGGRRVAGACVESLQLRPYSSEKLEPRNQREMGGAR